MRFASIAGTLFLAACATQPAKIQASYVSPIQYQNFDCQQAASELRRVTGKASDLYGSLEKLAKDDESQMAVGMILFWPALFFLEGGDGSQAVEYARLKGEKDALEQLATKNNCDISVQSVAVRVDPDSGGIAGGQGQIPARQESAVALPCIVAKPANASAAPGLRSARMLTGPEIRILFKEVETIAFPNGDGGKYNDDWTTVFSQDGTVESSRPWENKQTTGTWSARNSAICVTVTGGSSAFGLYDGCLGVYADPDSGLIAAAVPELKPGRFVMAENAFGLLAGLAPKPAALDCEPAKPVVVRRQPQPEPKLAAAVAPPQLDSEGYRQLSGPEIKRLFEKLSPLNYPGGDKSKASDEWAVSFLANGSVDAVSSRGSVSGSWRIIGNMQCVEVKSKADTVAGGRPFEGCFAVYVEPNKGLVAASLPDLKLDRFVMAKNAYRAIASIDSPAPVARVAAAPIAKSSPEPAAVPRRAGFVKLTGPQIRRLFKEIGTVGYPDDGSGSGSAEWLFSFGSDGTFEGSSAYKNSTAYGSWRVRRNRQCIEIKGGNADSIRPFEGCFAVFIDAAKGLVAAKISELNLRRFIMTDNGFGAIARIGPPAPGARVAAAPVAKPNPKPGTAPRRFRAGFVKLTGPQIRSLFKGIGTVGYPDDGSGYGSAEWLFSFSADGSFEGTSAYKNSTAYGSWRVRGNKQCIEITGGNADWIRPFEGCFTVYIDAAKGLVAANVPELKLRRFVMTDTGFGAIAGVVPN